jgi:hypothetical protein
MTDNAGQQAAVKAATETLRHHGIVMHPDDIAGLVWDVRTMALEEAAGIAEQLVGDRDGVIERMRIANAIRSLKGTQ